MNRFLSGKVALIILFTLVMGFIDLPYETQSKIIPLSVSDGKNVNVVAQKLQSMKYNLGLDLQGGTQLTYRIDLSQVEEANQSMIVDGVKEVITRRVNGLGVTEPNIYTAELGGETHIVVELAGIDDVEEAKDIVGKVIQLEFKEQKTEPTEEDTIKVKALADGTIARLGSGEDFNTLATELTEANSASVFLKKSEEFKFKDAYPPTIQDALATLPVGSVNLNVIEGSNGQIYTQTGLVDDKGFFIFNLIDKAIQDRTIEHEKEVKASHILIGYKDAANRPDTTVTRSYEEALAMANEVIDKLNNGEDFGALASQYSEDPSNKDNGGVLEEPVMKDGPYDPDFVNGALALNENNEYSTTPVETSFGLHIIKADEIKAAYTETSQEEAYKLEYLFFSATGDPWMETELSGEHFKNAIVEFNDLYLPYVSISFDDEGGKLFEDITERNIGKPVAIYVGGQLISAPTVQNKISGGQAQITGQYTVEEANALARDLNTGAIPAPIEISGQYNIGSTLGHQALDTSVKAALIGLAVLAIYMLVVYRLPGLIANISLLIYAIILAFLMKVTMPIMLAALIAGLVFLALLVRIVQNDDDGLDKLVSFTIASFAFFFLTFLLSSPVTLTLAGFAGIILSIGMAVDANVLIFERIKEELREGGSYTTSLTTGFSRAWASIRDANFSTLITCSILMLFGSSIIRGFAFNLATGILVSMFTALSISYTFLQIFKYGKIKEQTWLFGGLRTGKTMKESKLNLIGQRKAWFGFSGILVIISLFFCLAFGFNYGIDFKGGTLMEIQFPTEVSSQQIAESLKTINNDINLSLSKEEQIEFAINPDIIVSGENTYIMRLKSLDNEVHDQIFSEMQTEYGDIEELRYTSIGPKIGATLKKRAIIALGVAMIAIVLYIAFAFRKIPRHMNPWKFSLAAIITLAHDLIIVTGIFALLGHIYPNAEIDTLFITALLTLIGYSINDTIVVFDRVRENLKNFKGSSKLENLLNKALNETMNRSINTSLSTLFPLIALLFLGSDSIFYFVLALSLGIFVGTYSSIFIATPLLIELQKK